MRRLAQPDVVTLSAIGAALTALLCSPRLMLWSTRQFPIWYLEACLALGSFVLWAFVFAWHKEYTGRPVLTLKIPPAMLAIATVMGIAFGLGRYFLLDPILRSRTPEDFPGTYDLWIARILFSLAFLQLFMTFAPFAWLIRLVRNQTAAIILTVLFGVFVFLLSSKSSPLPVSGPLLTGLIVTRIAASLLSLWFYLRGGLILAWWWAFLIEARHLLSL